MEKVFKVLRENKHLFSDWAEYFAWDNNGVCWEFENEPYIRIKNPIWVSRSGKCREIKDINIYCEIDWKKSLISLKNVFSTEKFIYKDGKYKSIRGYLNPEVRISGSIHTASANTHVNNTIVEVLAKILTDSEFRGWCYGNAEKNSLLKHFGMESGDATDYHLLYEQYKHLCINKSVSKSKDTIIQLIKENKHMFNVWTKYLAWDIDGKCREFEHKPSKYYYLPVWASETRCSDLSSDVLHNLFDETNWKDSLFCLETMTFIN